MKDPLINELVRMLELLVKAFAEAVEHNPDDMRLADMAMLLIKKAKERK